VQESVREWAFTLPRQLPLWERESRWTPKTSESHLRGQNSMACGAFYIIGKLLERRCLKWARITHLDIWNTSYGQKKGRESKPGVRLPIWLPTRKSQESTRFTWLQATCHISFESSRWELQLCFRPRRDPRSTRKVMRLQSRRSPGWRSFGTPTRESRESQDKKAISMWASWRGAEYTIGSKVLVNSRGPGRGESCVKVPVVCPQHPRVSRMLN
jgi:hypothetical protein